MNSNIKTHACLLCICIYTTKQWNTIWEAKIYQSHSLRHTLKIRPDKGAHISAHQVPTRLSLECVYVWKRSSVCVQTYTHVCAPPACSVSKRKCWEVSHHEQSAALEHRPAGWAGFLITTVASLQHYRSIIHSSVCPSKYSTSGHGHFFKYLTRWRWYNKDKSPSDNRSIYSRNTTSH